MRIAIAEAYNGIHEIYKKELLKRGFKVTFFDIDNYFWLTNLNNTNSDVIIWHADNKGEKADLILEKIYFIEKYSQKRIFPDYNMYYSFNNKIRQKYLLNHLNIPIPPTFISSSKEDSLNKINNTNFPIILKDAFSFGGKGVYKIDCFQEAREIIEMIFSSKGFNDIHGYVYFQDYLSCGSRDLRVITIGDKVATAYWRIAQDGNWKSNVTQGSQTSFENIPKKALEICLSISKKMGFHWMSYDCFIDKDKVWIGEFSCNFGVEGPKAKGIDIREMQIEYLSKLLSK